MQGLIVLGSLASVAAIIIIVVKNWPAMSAPAGATDGTVGRHQVTLTNEQAGKLSEELASVRGEGGTVNFFIDKDNILQIEVKKGNN